MTATVTAIKTTAETAEKVETTKPAGKPRVRKCEACGTPLAADAPKVSRFCTTEACKRARANAASRKSRIKNGKATTKTTAELLVPALTVLAGRVDRIEDVLSGEITGDLTETSAEVKELAKRLTALGRKLDTAAKKS